MNISDSPDRLNFIRFQTYAFLLYIYGIEHNLRGNNINIFNWRSSSSDFIYEDAVEGEIFEYTIF